MHTVSLNTITRHAVSGAYLNAGPAVHEGEPEVHLSAGPGILTPDEADAFADALHIAATRARDGVLLPYLNQRVAISQSISPQAAYVRAGQTGTVVEIAGGVLAIALDDPIMPRRPTSTFDVWMTPGQVDLLPAEAPTRA